MRWALIKSIAIYFFPRFLSQRFIDTYDYAFLVHNRDYDDIYRKYPNLKILPLFLVRIICRLIWPIFVAEIDGPLNLSNKKLKGVVIGVGMTAFQLINNKEVARKKFIHAARLAGKVGVKVLGLGALSASLTKGGLDIINKVDICITTGHALTVYSVASHVYQIVDKIGINLIDSRVAIVGAAGSIGSNTARFLALNSSVRYLLLIDLEHKIKEVRQLKLELEEKCEDLEIHISTDVTQVYSCRIIITATNAPEALIKTNYVSPGSIIVNDAQPSDVDPAIYRRNDVLVIEGGTVFVPGVRVNFDFGLRNQGDVFSCLGETIVLAYLDDWDLCNAGRLDFAKVEKISSVARNLGIKISAPQNIHQTLDRHTLEKFSNISEAL